MSLEILPHSALFFAYVKFPCKTSTLCMYYVSYYFTQSVSNFETEKTCKNDTKSLNYGLHFLSDFDIFRENIIWKTHYGRYQFGTKIGFGTPASYFTK